MFPHAIRWLQATLLAALGTLALAQTERTLFVGPEAVPCNGAEAATCPLVSEGPDGPWTPLQGGIEGFVFEPGFRYRLRVREEVVTDPPAGLPGSRLVLIEELERTAVAPAASSLAGSDWRLLRFGPEGELREPLGGAAITLGFDEAGSGVSGSSGCNRYSGTVAVDGDALGLGPLVATRMACPGGLTEQEQLFLTALQGVERFERSGDRLTLFAPGARLEFGLDASTIADDIAALAGSRWQLQGFGDDDDEVAVQAEGGAAITLDFAADGTGLSGQAGCNSYRAALGGVDGLWGIGPIATTRTLCAEAVMQREQRFLERLLTVVGVERDGFDLTLYGADGALRFVDRDSLVTLPGAEATRVLSRTPIDPARINLLIGAINDDPLRSALAVLDIPNAPAVIVIRRDDRREGASESVITVLASDLADDAVSEQLFRLVFARFEDGRWSVTDAFQAVRCRRGEDTDAFVAGPCP